ncbi:hypothetical protein [Magnetospirillum fulvum]|uniref:Uncharacterized protein n=1 Tax=Magnetospirillum fulvum TaxID=1082 RepID=A0A1H6IG32_MAGFU|nr:hypothetical protein [Magnetospirillum fulvum]SEH46842.1 hypothetical protein SAMN04244559_02504 [Magnetospirillum fulvum]
MTVDLPDDQRLLLDGLLVRLESIRDSTALARFMAEVLNSLLRRRGDAEFRETIQAAFADGLIAHTLDEQKALAAEVIRVVIVKRPEIALAWQMANAASPPAVGARRAADAPTAASPEAPVAPPAAAPSDDYLYAEAEAGLGRYVADIVTRRLAQLQVPPAALPSAAYHSGRPFFLFDPALAQVLGDFVAGPFLRYCRDGMERRVYRPCEGGVPVGDEAWAAYMADKRDPVWAILLDRLARLSAAYKAAEAKQSAGEGGDPGYRLVEVPVTRPRHYAILGVEFALGHVTTTRKIKVKTPPANALEPSEREALDLLAELRHLAERARIDLPDSVDYQFLRTLFDFNVRQFVAIRDELMGLIANAGTSGPFLLERLHAIDDVLSNILADILGLMLFTRHGDGRFGLSDFYYFCQGAARDFSAVSETRPFSVIEIASRPRELVLQVREGLRRRVHPDKLLSAVEKLLECWTVIGRTRFGDELDHGLAMFDSFAPLFADDPDREVIAEITRMVRGQLMTGGASRESLMLAVGRAYEPIGRRTAGRY